MFICEKNFYSLLSFLFRGPVNLIVKLPLLSNYKADPPKLLPGYFHNYELVVMKVTSNILKVEIPNSLFG